MPNRVNWVPGGHDKVPPMIGGAMPLLNPRLNTELGDAGPPFQKTVPAVLLMKIGWNLNPS